jgi:hypothetical protein
MNTVGIKQQQKLNSIWYTLSPHRFHVMTFILVIQVLKERIIDLQQYHIHS